MPKMGEAPGAVNTQSLQTKTFPSHNDYTVGSADRQGETLCPTSAAADGAPTSGNTWVLPTMYVGGAYNVPLFLDYLRVTLPDEPATWAELDGWLGERAVRVVGWRGWYDRSASVLDGGLVAWCSGLEARERQGVMVDLPGRACACMGERLPGFLAWALEVGKVTRADWAMDDKAGLLTRERILECEAAGGLVSRWRGGLDLVENRLRGRVEGWTIYVGSRSSEGFLRFYDKGAERRAAGERVDEPWVRMELETKGKFADALARRVLLEGGAAVIGQVVRRIRFCEVVETDSNRWRWPVLPWWREFIGSVDPGPSLLVGADRAVTVEDLAEFLELQAGPAMVAVVLADGGSLDRILGILERARWRLQPKHYAALERAELERVADPTGWEVA